MKTYDPFDRDDLLCWYDFSDVSTVTLNGSNISQIDDKGPYGYHMTQGTASKQPLYTSQINGLNVGTSSYANNTHLRYVLSSFLQGTYGMSIFVVYQSTGSQVANASLFASDYDGSSDNTFQMDYDGDKLRWNPDDLSNPDIEVSTATRTPSLAECHYDWKNNKMFTYYNNSNYTEITDGTWKDNDGLGPRIYSLQTMANRNSATSFTGHIGEIIFYAGSSSLKGYIGNGMRDRVSKYLISKWGIV